MYMKTKKAVKTFTVDEGVYNWLVETLKNADVGIGVSNLLDGYLKYIYQGLKEILYYVEKNKIDIPPAFVIHKFLHDNTLSYMYDWEAIEKMEKRKCEEYKKMMDEEARSYVMDLVQEYEEKHRRKWWKKPLHTILRVDRSDI